MRNYKDATQSTDVPNGATVASPRAGVVSPATSDADSTASHSTPESIDRIRALDSACVDRQCGSERQRTMYLSPASRGPVQLKPSALPESDPVSSAHTGAGSQPAGRAAGEDGERVRRKLLRGACPRRLPCQRGRRARVHAGHRRSFCARAVRALEPARAGTDRPRARARRAAVSGARQRHRTGQASGGQRRSRPRARSRRARRARRTR